MSDMRRESMPSLDIGQRKAHLGSILPALARSGGRTTRVKRVQTSSAGPHGVEEVSAGGLRQMTQEILRTAALTQRADLLSPSR